MTALKLRLVGRSDQPLFKWQTTNAEAKRVSEGLLWVGSRDSNRKAPAKAVAAAPQRPASGNQCERIERKAARRRCPKALAPILDNIRKNAVHAR